MISSQSSATMKKPLKRAFSKPSSTQQSEVFSDLEQGVRAALETYSNVHRGSGHYSMVTTHLFEQARDIVLAFLGLNKGKYMVIFCTPRRAETLKAQLKPETYQIVTSQEIGLSLGLVALAIKSSALPEGIPFQTGGGTARLISPDRITWAKAPDKFEAGTPAIVNVIAFARALQLIRNYGDYAFHDARTQKSTAASILYHDKLEDYAGQELLDKLRITQIGGNVHVPTTEGFKPFINMDNGASTPTFTPIWDAFCHTLRQPGQTQQEIIHEVRSICATALGVPQDSYDVLFTSNTTEAINLVAESLGIGSEQDIQPIVLNTILEHTSNELPWRMVPGLSLIRLQVDIEGFIDLNEMEALLREYNQTAQHGKKRIKLVAVSGASNVLGTFNDLAEIGRIAHRYGAHLLVDAAQLVAHRKVEIEKCGIDYLAFSAHKVYAPFGTGVLVARKGLLNFSPVEMELIQSSGEENAGGIAALGKALELLQRIGMDLIREEEQALTARVLHGLAKIPGIRIFGIKDPDSPRFAQKGGVIIFELKGLMPNKLGKELARQGGIGVRYGCHCAHLIIKHLLNIPPFFQQVQHMILMLSPKINLPGLTRLSLGIGNTSAEVDEILRVLNNIALKFKTGSDKKSTYLNDKIPILSGKAVQQQMDDFVKTAARKVYAQSN
jgi:selenocysteine lyase/cysteine desulfurase